MLCGGGLSKVPVSNPKGRFLIVTDRDHGDYGEETAGFDDIGEIADRILQSIGMHWEMY